MHGWVLVRIVEEFGGVWGHCLHSLWPRTAEARMHERMQKAGLEFRDVVTYMEIPMKQEDASVSFVSWPVILPHIFASRQHVGQLFVRWL